MRVLHVVTWTGPGNPFGGPVTVAENLVSQLAVRGHTTMVLTSGPRRQTSKTDGGQARRTFKGYMILRRAGFSGLLSPSLLLWTLRNAKGFDVVHVHVCRDMVSLPAAFLATLRGLPVVLQPHGMVDGSQRRDAKVLDALLTRRTFRRASVVLALTERERNDIVEATGVDGSLVRLLPNGVPLPDATEEPQLGLVPEFLFCSRLHPRKRAPLFVRSAIDLLGSGTEAIFTVAGADEGDGPQVDGLISHAGTPVLRREPAREHADALDRIRRCDALVLPSVDEPYPMVVLEAMSLGKPVVITESCGLAHFVLKHRAGLVIPGDSQEALSTAMSRLAGNAATRQEMGRNAQAAVRAELSIGMVVSQLESVYVDVIG